jgi:hypothetical protein
MPDCTPAYYWLPILTYVLPPVGALLSATALWVASRARSTSEDARSTSLAVADSYGALPSPLERRGSRTGVPGRKRS